jgi:two-component system sensor histidine kinase KdpD
MLCLFPNASGTETLLRKVARATSEEEGELFVVHVETPKEATTAIPSEKFHALLDSLFLAADLGAEVVWLKAPDVTQALTDFARDERISKIILHRTRPGVGSRLLRRSITRQLINRGRQFEIEIVGYQAQGVKQ